MDFSQDLRKMCRNPKCRSKLKEPTSNLRDAFCARGCSTGFYRTRCRVCEETFERKNDREHICGRRKCRTAFASRRGDYFGSKYPEIPKPGTGASGVNEAARNPLSTLVFSPLKTDPRHRCRRRCKSMAQGRNTPPATR